MLLSDTRRTFSWKLALRRSVFSESSERKPGWKRQLFGAADPSDGFSAAPNAPLLKVGAIIFAGDEITENLRP
jgi:hypothetical protein